MRSYSWMKPVGDVRIRMSPDLKVQSYSQGPSPQASNLLHKGGTIFFVQLWKKLGGGFKCCLFSPIPGEDSQFD